MTETLTREVVEADDLQGFFDPLAKVAGISSVLVHDVGQGDAISILDLSEKPVLRIDYGGLQSGPFKGKTGKKRTNAINAALPVGDGAPLMLTHWDEDHWCSARKHTDVVTKAHWIVPRQRTSPRAVRLSAKVETIHCVPEAEVGTVFQYRAQNGDSVWWEKIDRFDPAADGEDCNLTGLAFSVTRGDRVIFLPGDAPFDRIRHYRLHQEDRRKMIGLVAFHHGSGSHWLDATERFLRTWATPGGGQKVVFSCGDPNTYDHPVLANYQRHFDPSAFVKTPDVRKGTTGPIHISF
jgi:beta-lactamase superfamily II metal-dependent hydrolase